MTALLSVHGLTASYGEGQVLAGLDFEVQRGGVTVLLGANGAGKTTTLRAICGMVRREGSIIFDGKPIQNLSTEGVVRLGVAHVPDGRGTFTQLTVDENLQLGAITRRGRKEIEHDIERCFGYFPVLKERRSQQAGTLSGGEQQMLAVARALMLRPKLMLLDEPSFGLAPMIVKQIFDIFRTLNASTSMSMLIVEQNAALALELADHAYLLETGRVVFAGRPDDIRNDPALRRSYLGY
ncbi:MAG: ABC transporter ATP-binding protein [Rhizobiales bacterium 65-9]|nr:ABC transporter ATP-binding protein [Hyphomicrobiales bacterium]OJY35305.1 MAG: ABC transporter ATP-binding protein [Rhizobiales bacterium 65-9]